MRLIKPFIWAIAPFALAGAVQAQTFTAGTFGYQQPDAEAIFLVGSNSLSINLINLEADYNVVDVGQNLSAILFTLSGSSSGASINGTVPPSLLVGVNGDGSVTSKGSITSLGWVFSSLGGGEYELDVLSGSGHAGPAHTLIGGSSSTSEYANANGSIAGNGPHNSFLQESAYWNLTFEDLGPGSTVTAATFQFGTNDGSGRLGGTPAPEPLTVAGFCALLGLLKKRGVGRTSSLT